MYIHYLLAEENVHYLNTITSLAIYTSQFVILSRLDAKAQTNFTRQRTMKKIDYRNFRSGPSCSICVSEILPFTEDSEMTRRFGYFPKP